MAGIIDGVRQKAISALGGINLSRYNQHVQALSQRQDSGRRLAGTGDKGNWVRSTRQVKKDGWMNKLIGLGVPGQDKRNAGQAYYQVSMKERDCEELYASDPLARRIINIPADDMTREFIEFDDPDGKISGDLERLQARGAFNKALKFADLYGGSGILLVTDEPLENYKEPLDIKNSQRITGLVVLNRYELWVQTNDVQIHVNKPDFGMPEYYRIIPRKSRGTAALVQVHASRIIRFDGVPLPTILNIENNWWSDSVFTGLYEMLRDYAMSHQAAAHLVTDIRVWVYKMQGLASAVGAGTEDKLISRLSILDRVRSIMGTYVLDMDEDMQAVEGKVGPGLADILKATKERLQAVTPIPHTILFNETPSAGGSSSISSSGKGESETRQWYDTVKAMQENKLRPKLNRFFEVLFNSPDYKGIPKGWGFRFASLWQMDEQTQATLDKTRAEADTIRIGDGVLESDEVRKMRYPNLEQAEISMPSNPANTNPHGV